MNPRQERHARETDIEDLETAIRGADVFLGLSGPDSLTPEMLASMAETPIVFAMANPDPEIDPKLARQVRPDVIIATGRSDYPNQVNNVLGFPYIFRGALDVRASRINDEMKIAAARTIAELAREDVPDEVAAAYGIRPTYGRDYIIPAPFDSRLLQRVPPAVARAAMESGVARGPIVDFEEYENRLRARIDPTASILQGIQDLAALARKKVLFAEGEDDRVVRAALAYTRGKLGTAVLLGRESEIRPLLEQHGGQGETGEIEILDPALSPKLETYTEHLYQRLQRQGHDRDRLHARSDGQPACLRQLHDRARRYRCPGHRGHPQIGLCVFQDRACARPRACRSGHRGLRGGDPRAAGPDRRHTRA